ncbi:MAG: tetratricopeptide repeat protein [Candidatus Omnitrophica bacterium]|nr:tetratricopeptide repeat protein [Candidatus Omnitrophota bacterium]
MLSAPFKVLDDQISILDNTQIQSLRNIPAIFKTSFFGANRYYRPLVTLSFALNYRWFGFNPFFFNLTNLFLHLLVSLLVFKSVSLILKNKVLGFLTALLFVIHPINAEAVSYIAGRSILLCAFFEWSSFILYCLFREKKKIVYYALSLFCFCLALLSKESSVMLPFVLLAYEFFIKNFVRRDILKLVKNISPFFVLLVTYAIIRKILGIVAIPHGFMLKDILLGIATFLTSIFGYLRIFIFPYDLYFDRIFPLEKSFFSGSILGVVLIACVCLFILIKLRKHIKKEMLFFLVFLVFTLFPVSQIIPLRLQPGYIIFPNHFWYVPSVGIFALFVIVSVFVYKRISPIIFRIMIILWFVLLSVTTIQENIYATNEEAVIGKILFYQPSHVRAHTIMGLKRAEEENFKEAEYHFEEALKADPFNARARISLGKALVDQGQYWQGISQYDQVVGAENLEKTLNENKTKVYEILQNKYEQMLKSDPENPSIYYSLGVVYSEKEEFLKAISLYQKTLLLDPSFDNARQNLCYGYHMLGEGKKAQECLEGKLP